MSNFERFEKIESPFERSENESGEYTVDPIVKDEFEWVFSDERVQAVEKLNGQNIAVYIEDNVVSEIYTREGNQIRPFIDRGGEHIIKGVVDAFERGWIDEYLGSDGLYYGELVGPRVKANPYDLDQHVWVPFTYAQEHLSYNTWGEYPKTFEAISSWFEEGLIPLFYSRINNIPLTTIDDSAHVEGIVFTHPDGRFAKLRKDMFEWHDGVNYEY